MRIGIDARLIAYRAGGISTYVAQLVAALGRLHSEHTFIVLESRKAQGTITAPEMRRAVVWTPPHHRLERIALSVELARLRLDVLHSTDFIPPLRGARRDVVSIHDLTFLHYPQHLTAESLRYYAGQIELAAAQADHILTISESSRRDIVAMLGVPADKVTVHLPGVDGRFRPLTPEAMAGWRAKLGLPERYFLCVGTFEPRKNIIGLLDAYALLRQRVTNAPPLLLAGSRGWLYDETLARIGQLGLEEAVQVRENLPGEALPALYNGATALMMPSFYEGFGLPPLEAMACGTLPIVSNRSSLPEVVGEVGALVEPEDARSIADAMQRALEDDAWREVQGAAGLRRAAGFRWDDAARIALAAYTRVV
jgi:glycosyltransferase involved in cell wall biosynthesis